MAPVNTRLAYVVVASVSLLLYARTATFDFVRADDEDLILGNRAFLTDVGNVPRAFTRSYFEVEGDTSPQKTYYRPVAIASFMVDATVSGLNARAFHATNTVLHALAASLLVALALSWGASVPAALACALVFAVHPVNTQAVAWIAGRNDLLLAVFGVASLLNFAALNDRVRQPLRAAVHVLTFALALFSKETGILFPALAVLQQKAILRQPLSRAHKAALAADAAVIAVWAILRAQALSGPSPEFSTNALRALVGNLPQLLVHAGKMLVPIRLNVSPGVDALGLALGAAAIGLAVYAIWKVRDRGPFDSAQGKPAIVAACWAAGFIVPTLAVPALPAFEHRAYLPLIGILAATAVMIRVPRRPVVVVAVTAVLATLATVTYGRQEVFRNPLAYWTDGTRDPEFGPFAHVNLGQLHEAAGRPQEARREYLRALERNAETPKAHNNLGVVLMTLDEPDLALRHFKEESQRHPWNADAWFNLGLWMETRGENDAARQHYERALAANPSYYPAREKLAELAK
jgi:protein O-mannosyl-transferase